MKLVSKTTKEILDEMEARPPFDHKNFCRHLWAAGILVCIMTTFSSAIVLMFT